MDILLCKSKATCRTAFHAQVVPSRTGSPRQGHAPWLSWRWDKLIGTSSWICTSCQGLQTQREANEITSSPPTTYMQFSSCHCLIWASSYCVSFNCHVSRGTSSWHAQIGIYLVISTELLDWHKLRCEWYSALVAGTHHILWRTKIHYTNFTVMIAEGGKKEKIQTSPNTN